MDSVSVQKALRRNQHLLFAEKDLCMSAGDQNSMLRRDNQVSGISNGTGGYSDRSNLGISIEGRRVKSATTDPEDPSD